MSEEERKGINHPPSACDKDVNLLFSIACIVSDSGGGYNLDLHIVQTVSLTIISLPPTPLFRLHSVRVSKTVAKQGSTYSYTPFPTPALKSPPLRPVWFSIVRPTWSDSSRSYP